MNHKTILRAGISVFAVLCMVFAFFAGKYSNRMEGKVAPFSEIKSITYKNGDITEYVDLVELQDYLADCVYEQIIFSRHINPGYYDFAITMSVGGEFRTLYLADESRRMYLMEDYNTILQFGSGGELYTARIIYPETYDTDLYALLLKNVRISNQTVE